ncbi:MAG: hypothetical protein H6Q79_2886 [Deltaproteobacteria bacterium]|nr:hypothetical protein [Deltaproteobacteria bacterium]
MIAAWALSFITSPRYPVMVTFPFPSTRDTSTKRMSPPVGVQARPVATPTSSFSPSVSGRFRGAPRYFARRFGVMTNGPFSPSAIFRATFRHTWPISRSRLRSPASRVYPWTMARIVLSPIVIFPGRIPFSSSWRGNRNFLAIASLSMSVYPDRGMISIRSFRAGGTGSMMFAVAMNRTFDRSKGTFR